MDNINKLSLSLLNRVNVETKQHCKQQRGRILPKHLAKGSTNSNNTCVMTAT